jgi:DNA-binding CsgD family transcriptional regulator
LYQELGNQSGAAVSACNLGCVALQQGDAVQAARSFAETLMVRQHSGERFGIAVSLMGLGGVAVVQEHPAQAARLLSAAQALLDAIGAVLESVDQTEMDRGITTVRAVLDPNTFAAAWAAGQALAQEAAIAEALAYAQTVQTSARPSPLIELTAREIEVLRLVARGLTNRQVAAQLIITDHTVHAHLQAIYSKLGVNSRTAATRMTIELGLI